MPGRGIIGLVAFILTTLIGLVPLADAREYFTINNFHADISIFEDNHIVVTETIELTFHQKRHGIYREIPYKYETELGQTIRMPIKILEVKKANGEKWDYRVSYEGNVINVRIGHPDIYVRGQQTYVVTYRVNNALMFFEDYDELYWNITGNYWEVPIEQASATINLLSDKPSSQLLTQCYTGYYGHEESDCEWETYGSSARFMVTRPLRPREGMTVAFSWDKGIVRPPSAWERFASKYNLAENWVFILPIFVLIFMIVQWRRKGRDPRVREAVTVMYEPPKFEGKELSAAEVGSLVDERMDQRDLTGAIVGLAVKGYIKIEETKKEGIISLLDTDDYALHKLKEPDSELSRFESQLMGALFSGAARKTEVSSLKNKFYKNIQSLKSTLWDGLKEKKYFSIIPSKVRATYLTIGIVFIILAIFIIQFSGSGLTIRSAIATAICGVVIMAFSNAMPVKTREGALALYHVLGFQEFMNRADKDRLERMGKDVFYKYMPYAIALDVVDHWAEAFKDLQLEPPRWYVSRTGFRSFSPISFSQSIGHTTGSLSKAAFSAPRGSGAGGRGGGGGFSGGGGGGGGGGSW